MAVRLPVPVRTAVASGLAGLALVPLLAAAGQPAAAAPAPGVLPAPAATTGGTVGVPSTPVRPSSVATLALADATPRATTGTGTASLADSGTRSTKPFALVGVSWTRGSADDATFAVRTRTRGVWTGWSTLSRTDVGPDGGRREDAGSTRTATEPLWVGTSDGVQVKLVSAARRPTGVQVELVDPGTATGDASFANATVPTSSSTASSSSTSSSSTTTTGSTAPRTAAAVAARAPGVAPAIISRAAWGADERLRSYNPNCTKPDYGTTVKMGFVHHTDNANSYTAAEVPGMLRSILAYHVQSNRWCDLGYNYLVDRFGRVFEGRWGGVTLPVIGAHTGGFNTDTFAASLLGNFTSVAPPAAMSNALADLFAWKLGSYYRNPTGKTVLTAGVFSGSRFPAGSRVTFNTISGHRDANFTTCPGERAYSTLPALRSAVTARLPRSAVATRYAALGGPAGTLGEPVLEGERAVPYGLQTRFQRGSLTWSSGTGVRMLTEPTTATYLGVGGVAGVLGYPVRDEAATGVRPGRYAQFQRGFVHWSAATGAHETHGLIGARWRALGFENSRLGFPQTDEIVRPDKVGRYNRFEGGYVFWSPATGAHEVTGPVVGRWRALGFESGVLGYPTSGTLPTSDLYGEVQRFQRGSIYSAPGTGAHEVRGAIRDRYLALDEERGVLGYPTGDEQVVSPGIVRTTFQRGTITWDTATNVTTVTTD